MTILAKRLIDKIDPFSMADKYHWTEVRDRESQNILKAVRHAAFIAERAQKASVTPRTFLAMPRPIAARVQRHINSHAHEPYWTAVAFAHAGAIRRECWAIRNAAMRREQYEQWEAQQQQEQEAKQQQAEQQQQEQEADTMPIAKRMMRYNQKCVQNDYMPQWAVCRNFEIINIYWNTRPVVC